jgi:porin
MHTKIDAVARRPISMSMLGLMTAASILGFSNVALAAEAMDKALDLSVSYSADVTGVVSGGLAKRGRLLDNLEIGADLDLDKAMGWKGATAHALVLNNSGGMPNEDAGTAQGIDNIEVSRQRLRLFEAWVQQSFAGDKASALVGLYDLNSEFYANDSAGLLIAPAFGIGSELAATGPNGPSIFPSTSLAVRLKWTPAPNVYAQVAALNANAGVLGDPGGVDTSFDSGALVIAEAGWIGAGKIALGAWRYTDKQDDIRDLTALGDPAQRTAQGVYLLLERRLTAAGDDAVRQTTAFARLGASDADTTDFKGGWQAGMLVEHVFDSRPQSAFSIGVNQGYFSRKARANVGDAGGALKRAESAIELTYADSFGPLTLQPDLQYIKDPAGDAGVGHALVAALRVSLNF